MKALIGTPSGSSHCGSITGFWCAGAVKRALGCAAGLFDAGVQCSPRQSMSSGGAFSVIPSHQTSPSGVRATFVKIVFFAMLAIAFRFDFTDVPGATPKYPDSGLMAYSLPSLPGLIQAMS